jgi:hypothetical protein
MEFNILSQGSHYLQIRGRSDFSFRELTGRSGRQQREVGRLLGEVNEVTSPSNLKVVRALRQDIKFHRLNLFVR